MESFRQPCLNTSREKELNHTIVTFLVFSPVAEHRQHVGILTATSQDETSGFGNKSD
jgi:hypothetical protein